MSKTWDLEAPAVSNNDLKLARLVREIFGNKFPHMNENVTKAMSLYGYLAKHIDESPEVLAKQIQGDGGPMFTVKDIREIQAILWRQRVTPFFQRVTRAKTGGSLDADPSRSKFFDKMIRKIVYPLASRIPPSWDGVLWYTFLVYNLEQTEFIGPFISTALDTITLSLPVMAELAATGFEKLISLAPVPYASFAGEIIGYVVSLLFIIFAVFLNITRKHFGSAFKVSLEAIPVFGDMLMDAAQSLETGAERYIQNRNKILKPVEKISPTLYQTGDYYIPDVNIHPTAPPPLNYDAVKKDVAEYVMEETGLSDTMAAATTAATAMIPTIPSIPSIPGSNTNNAINAINAINANNTKAPIASNAINAINTNNAKAPIASNAINTNNAKTSNAIPVTPTIPATNIKTPNAIPVIPATPTTSGSNNKKTAFAPIKIKKRGGGTRRIKEGRYRKIRKTRRL